MPIRKVKGGFQWGRHGKVYPTRTGAANQAAAAHANGYKEELQLVTIVRMKRLLGESIQPTDYVYRMEDEGGRGPYCWHIWNSFPYQNRWSGQVPPRDVVNPRRAEDFDSQALRRIFDEGKQNLKVFYGFQFREDCLDWFGDLGIRLLSSVDYRLMKVPAAVVFPSKSGRQVAFVWADGASEEVSLPFGIQKPQAVLPVLDKPDRILSTEQKQALMYLF